MATGSRLRPVVTAGSANRAGDGTLSPTLTVPYFKGDLQFLQAYTDTGSLSITSNGGGAWTALTGSPFSGPGTERLYLWYRIVADTDSAPTITVSGSSGATNPCIASTWVVRAGTFDPAAPIHAIGTANNGTGTTATNTGVTTSVNDAVVVHVAGWGDDGTQSTWTFGGSATGVTERIDVGTTSGNDASIGAADLVQSTAGATGTASVASTVSAPWISLTIAIEPNPTTLAYRVVGEVGGGGASISTRTITLTEAVASGETMVVAVVGGASQSLSTVTDSKGNSYTVRLNATTTKDVAVATAPVTTPLAVGDTITITWGTASSVAGGVAIAVNDTLGSTFYSTSNSQTSTPGTDWTTGSITTDADRNFLMVAIAASGGSSRLTTTASDESDQDSYRAAWWNISTSGQTNGAVFVREQAGAITETAAGTWQTGGQALNSGIIAIPFSAATAKTVVPGRVTEANAARSIVPKVGFDAIHNQYSPTRWWHLDELSGTSAAESVGGTDNGTIAGTPGLGHPSIPNRSGSTAIKFDGIDDEITLPGTNPTTGSAEIWFEWVAGTAIMRDHTSAGGWIFGLDNGGTFAVRLAGSTRNTTLTTAQVADGARHQLVVTWAAGTVPRIYIDGVDVTSGATVLTPAAATMPWHIMRNGNGGSFSRGRVDEVLLYGTQLDAHAVASLYANGAPVATTPTTYDEAVVSNRPLGRWKFDEPSGSSAADSSAVSGGTSGTYVGSPTLAQPGLTPPGTSVTFDGVDDEVTIPDLYGGAGSLEFWFKWTAGTALGRVHSTTGGFIAGFANGSTFAVSNNGSGSAHNTTKSISQVRDGNLHHLLIAWDAVSGEGKVYLDGVDITNGTWTTGGPAASLPFHLMRNGANAEYATGSMDSVSVYPAPLTAAAVLELYTLGRGAFRATETDTAQSLRFARIAGQATETDTARSITPVLTGGSGQTISVGQASETDTSRALVPPLARASETDTARRLGIAVGVSRATETDVARLIKYVELVTRAAEADAAQPIAAIWFPLVDQAEETDEAQTIVRLLVYEAFEADTAGTWARRLVNPAFETDTSQSILPSQNLQPDFIPLDPAADSQVFNPLIANVQELEPEPFALPSATVFDPALAQGTPIYPDVLDPALTPTVFDPTMIVGTLLYPDVGPTGTSTVFEPTLIRGQFLYPDELNANLTPTVFDPTIIPGQPLSPDTLDPALSITVYDPALIPGTFLYPDELGPALTPTVFEPEIFNDAQQLYPDFWQEDEPTVFEPTLALRQPSVIVAGERDMVPGSIVRTAR